MVETFCKYHIDLVLAHVNRERFEVIGVGMGVMRLKLLSRISSGLDKFREAGSEHELLIKSELLIGNSFHFIISSV